MAGLVPAIYVFLAAASSKTWMPGTSPGMTKILKYYFFAGAFAASGLAAASSGLSSRSTLAAWRSLAT
ncbi:MAG: hypothetical protein QOH32_3561 [Bradyrhizobium sp.]|nr:hypothetical protein [Bradyrhizobium sp.]